MWYPKKEREFARVRYLNITMSECGGKLPARPSSPVNSKDHVAKTDSLNFPRVINVCFK